MLGRMTNAEAKMVLTQVASTEEYFRTVRLTPELAEACRKGAKALGIVIDDQLEFPEILRD